MSINQNSVVYAVYTVTRKSGRNSLLLLTERGIIPLYLKPEDEVALSMLDKYYVVPTADYIVEQEDVLENVSHNYLTVLNYR